MSDKDTARVGPEPADEGDLEGDLLFPEGWRPRTRADCECVPRPCPFVACRFNNYLFVSKDGYVRFSFRKKSRGIDLEPHEVPPESSCALDIAEEGGMTLEAVGKRLMMITRERVRQIEAAALRHAQKKCGPRAAEILRAMQPEPEPPPPRRGKTRFVLGKWTEQT